MANEGSLDYNERNMEEIGDETREACRETTAFPLRSNISSISVMSSGLHIQQVVTNPAVRRGGNIEPIKICALKAPGIVVSSPFKLSVVVRAKLTDSGKQPCAVL